MNYWGAFQIVAPRHCEAARNEAAEAIQKYLLNGLLRSARNDDTTYLHWHNTKTAISFSVSSQNK